MAPTSRFDRAGRLTHSFVLRLAALLLLSLGVLACNSDLPGTRPSAPEASSGNERVSPVTSRFAEDRTPSGTEPRGEWETRLWIGIWCDRESSRGDLPFRVEIDGIQMMETRSTCRSYERPPHNPPNAGFLGFTLAQGQHVLTVFGPEGAPFERPLNIEDDTWVIVDYEAEDGVPTYSVRTRTVQLAVDTTYNPATRPIQDRPEPDRDPHLNEPLGVVPPSAGAGSGAAAEDGSNSGQADDEWHSADDSRAGSSNPSPSRSGSSRSGSDRGGDDGWVEGNPGYLSVESGRPVRVYVDGSQVGEAPLRRHTLNSGQHRVMLRGADGFERRFNVTIESGRNYSLVNDQ